MFDSSPLDSSEYRSELTPLALKLPCRILYCYCLKVSLGLESVIDFAKCGLDIG